ncbi:MAG TPA: hypothetical protein VLG27_02705 [Candidatus Saccharimonadia bacterium]|nr:hypothetical protein [Candidatus Saccharimonadia bacterium]
MSRVESSIARNTLKTITAAGITLALAACGGGKSHEKKTTTTTSTSQTTSHIQHRKQGVQMHLRPSRVNVEKLAPHTAVQARADKLGTLALATGNRPTQPLQGTESAGGGSQTKLGNGLIDIKREEVIVVANEAHKRLCDSTIEVIGSNVHNKLRDIGYIMLKIVDNNSQYAYDFKLARLGSGKPGHDSVYWQGSETQGGTGMRGVTDNSFRFSGLHPQHGQVLKLDLAAHNATMVLRDIDERGCL